MNYMNEHNAANAPFQTLGSQLKFLREQSKQSLAEVSGAVEIDQGLLERIEAGQVRPAEDILLLLISHFDVLDKEAVRLWEMAGYEGDVPEQIRADVTPASKSIVMLLALDVRTIYSDGLDINCNQAGVTLSFNQSAGQGQPTPVARLGMSYQQAENVLATLQQALLHAKYLRGPKALPPTTDSPENQL